MHSGNMLPTIFLEVPSNSGHITQNAPLSVLNKAVSVSEVVLTLFC